jgi:hypothetical protein
MDHSRLATTAITLITQLLVKGVAKFKEESDKGVFLKTTNLKDWLWQQFEETKVPKLRQTADLLETDPTTFREALIRLLITFLQKNPDVTRELSRRVKELEPQAQAKYNVNLGKVYVMNLGDYGRVDHTFYGQDHDRDDDG